jgi:hypothetical protein
LDYFFLGLNLVIKAQDKKVTISVKWKPGIGQLNLKVKWFRIDGLLVIERLIVIACEVGSVWVWVG